MKRKLMGLLMTVFLLLGLVPQTVWAAGMVIDINTPQAFAEMEASGHYRLTEDITITQPFGSASLPFSGTFDGDGHTVTLDIHAQSTYQGLFAYCKDADIKNLVVKGKIETTLGYAAGITPKAENGSIVNCGAEVNITCSGTNATIFGGISGYISGTTIQNCYSNSVISGKIKNVGGIVGQINTTAAVIENCYNWGTITSTASSTPRVGGIVGYGNKVSRIENCYNSGKIEGSAQTGAIAGNLCADIQPIHCYYLTGTHDLAVGFAPQGAILSGIKQKSEEDLKQLASELGSSYKTNSSAYPLLVWQKDAKAQKVPVVSVVVNGIGRSGKNLSAQANGAENAVPTGVKYQWQTGETPNGSFADIPGATTQGFALTPDVIGSYIRVTVSGDEDSSATSAAIGPILISEEDVAMADKAQLGALPTMLRSNQALTLPSSGTNGSAITWSSSNTDVIDIDGTVKLPEAENQTVTLSATLKCGSASERKDFSLLVYSEKAIQHEASDASIYLSNAIGSLQWYHLNPICGKDSNVSAVLKAALQKNGYDQFSISIQSVENPEDGKAKIAADGAIRYYYSDPNQLGGPKVTSIPITFKLQKGNESKEYQINAVIGWDVDQINRYLDAEIFSALSIPETADKNFDLPAYIGGKGGKTWVKLSYAVSDASALTISDEKRQGSTDEKIYNPYVGKIKTLPADQTIRLTVTAEFNYSQPSIPVTKVYLVTVKADPVAAEQLRGQLLAKLNAGFAVKGLADYVSGDQLTETNGVYTAKNDIKLLTTHDFGVDGKYYPITLKSSDMDVIITPDVNNAARVYVYRALPGQSAKSATLTVSLTDKSSGISASKEFLIQVLPLTQEEIDAEIKLMELVKLHYFDGIKNENTSADNVTGNLHAFQEAYLKDQVLTYIYDHANLVNHGIVPVAMDGWETLEQWRTFRSSNASVITHENLLVERQKESKAVTVTSYLSSETLGKYAEKYPGHPNFQKLYYQPVSANLIVSGTNPTSTKPIAEKVNVSFALQSDKNSWISNTSVSGLEEGATVFDVFTKVLSDRGYSYSSRGSYVYSIKTPDGKALGELDLGAKSGWMYKVNGVIPSSYMAAHSLKNGDRIVVFFTKDYTEEVGYSHGGKPEQGAQTSGVLTPKVTVQNGKAEATVDSKTVTSALENNKGKVIIAPELSGSVQSVSVSLTASSLKEIAKHNAGMLNVETACGHVSIPNETLNAISGQAGGNDVKMMVATKSPKDVPLSKEDTEQAVIVEVSISSGGKQITSFGGSALSVSIPVTGNGKEGEIRKVIVISADGSVETLAGKVVMVNGKSFVQVKLNHLSTFVVTAARVPIYDDVNANAWYYDAVQYASLNGSMKGIKENNFAPELRISRAMLVTVLYRLAGSPEVSGESNYCDVLTGAWYSDAVMWAGAKGIVHGFGDGTFWPDRTVTREEAAAIMYQYASYKGLNLDKTADLSGYSDVETVSIWAQSAVKWANASGYMKGTSAKMLSPKEGLTRAQAAAILMRLSEYQVSAVR